MPTNSLPVVTLHVDGVPRTFFVDSRLRELRAVSNPHDRIGENNLCGVNLDDLDNLENQIEFSREDGALQMI